MIGALGAVSQRFAGYVNKVGALELSQKNVPLGNSKIVKESPVYPGTKVEEYCCTFVGLLLPALTD